MFRADGVSAIAPDAESIHGECELSGPSPHSALGYNLVVDVKHGRTLRLVVEGESLRSDSSRESSSLGFLQKHSQMCHNQYWILSHECDSSGGRF
jgi:hypothetical protein